MKRFALTLALSSVFGFFLVGCESLREKPEISAGHINKQESKAETSAIPEPVRVVPALPEPQPFNEESTHTIVVYSVPVAELLFSLARDSGLNLDIDSDIDDTITLNAVEQPLGALLERISESADLSYQIKNNVLRVKRDKPFLRNYSVDYLNIARTSVGSVAVSTQISSTGQGAGGDSSGDTGNSSDTLVENVSEHAFWQTLYGNISGILNNAQGPDGQSAAADPDIIMNREAGIIAVRATERKHRDIQRFIDIVQVNTQRQVLI